MKSFGGLGAAAGFEVLGCGTNRLRIVKPNAVALTCTWV